jgi:hypothetical protein
MSRINGDFEAQQFIELSPSELYNLNGYVPVYDNGAASMDGFATYELGGTFMKDGRHEFIAQKTIVVPSRDGLYVIQINSMGPDSIRDALIDDFTLINTQSRITTPAEPPNGPALSESTGDPISRADVDAWLGQWTGPIDQSGSRPYSVRMTLDHNGKTVVGTVEYPELSCSGALDDASLRGDVLSVVETITVKGSCMTTVNLELTLRPGEILYHFDESGGGDGVLRRP